MARPKSENRIDTPGTVAGDAGELPEQEELLKVGGEFGDQVKADLDLLAAFQRDDVPPSVRVNAPATVRQIELVHDAIRYGRGQPPGRIQVLFTNLRRQAERAGYEVRDGRLQRREEEVARGPGPQQ